jgi:hypothetical protein
MVFETERWRRSGRQYHAAESIVDHRARLAHEQAEMQQRRLEAQSGQVAIENSPSERIRIWEELHGLPLPRTPTHKLLQIIASATNLQLEQVREVQRLRYQAARGISAGVAGILPKS